MKIIIISGPTAVGKSKLSIKLAQNINGEIINADAMQVYRYLDIGTSKPSLDELKLIKHHLFSLINPDEEMNAGLFVNYAQKIMEDIFNRGKNPIITGGTGLYLRALTQGLSEIPEVPVHIRKNLLKRLESSGLKALYHCLCEVDTLTANRLKSNDTQRILRALEVFEAHGKPLSSFHNELPVQGNFYEAVKIFLTMEREALYQKIEQRVDNMINQGFLDEVRGLMAMGYNTEHRSLRSPGYLEALRYFKGEIKHEEMVYLIKKKHKNYAKRQFTWFKKEKGYLWINVNNFDDILDIVKKTV